MFAELMILGFISLLLTFGQDYIAKICIPLNVVETMLPCAVKSDKEETKSSDEEHRRRLLWFERRSLAGASYAAKCKTVSLSRFFCLIMSAIHNDMI